MAGTVDEKFVSRLDDFTKSLEGIVEILKEEVKKRNADPVNAMLGAMGEDLHRVVADMQKVVATTDRIESNTKEILQQLKANKEKKEKTGGLGEIAEVDNKQKIIDAIKVIGLITVGIVAVGLALKLISPVSMTSAIGIGLAIVFITGAFVMSHKLLGDLKFGRIFDISKMMLIMAATLLATSMVLAFAPTISFTKAVSLVFVATAMGTALVLITKAIENAKIRPEYYGKMMMLPIILPVIALGIVLSSWILSKITPLTLAQGITTLLVAGAIGGSLFLISKTLQHAKLGPGDIFKFLLLPIIVPALALGIVVAASILSNIKTLTIGQALSAIFVAGAIGVLIFLMKPAIAKMKDFSLKEIIGVMGLVVALSVGLVLSSIILSKMHLFTLGQAFRMIMTSAAIGLAVLFLTPAVYILKSIKSEDMFKAAGNIIILAGAIAESSILLSFGDYSYAPDWKWAIGTGLALAAFAGVAWIINKIGIDAKGMVKVGLTMLAISATISLVSIILGFGDYGTYPSLGWSFGVGISLVAFGAGMVALGLLMQSGGASFMLTGGIATLGVAITIAAVSQILGMGDYGDYPSVGWAFGVGLSMVAFGGAMVVLGLLISTGIGTFMAVGAVATLGVALTIAAVSQILGLGNYGKYPTAEWALGVGLSMVGFGAAMVALGIVMMTGIGAGAMALGALGVLLVASSVVAVSYILGTGNYSKFPTLEWAMGAGLSLVAFGGAMLVMGIGLPLLYLGSLSMRLIANSISETSETLAEGNYTGGPTLNWAKSTSLLMGSFTKAMLDTAFYPNTLLESSGRGLLIIAQNIVDVSAVLSTGTYTGGPKEGWAKNTSDLMYRFALTGTMLSLNPFLVFGLAQMMFVAQSIADASNVLGTGNYTGGPNKDWAEGVGLSIKAFAEGISAMQETDGFFSFFGSEDQGQKIINIAQAMMIANQMLSGESWTTNYPTKAWAEGVGLSIKAFAEGLSALQSTDTILGSIFGENQSEKIITIANAMMEANMLLGSVNWSNNYPSKEWAEGVGAAINAFAKPLAEMSAADMSTRDISRGIRRLALGIMEAAEILNIFDWSKIKTYPSLEWSQGVGAAIYAFAKPLAEMSAADMSTRDISKGIRRLALGMVEAAIILDIIDWKEKDYPTQEWTNGVGNAIGTFTKYLVEIEKNDIGRGEIRNLGRVIDAMSSVAIRFAIYGALGIWDSYPPQSWSEGVGGAIDKFVGYLKEFQKNKIEDDDITNLKDLTNSMINTALIFTIFGEGIWETYPPQSWVDGVGGAIDKFVGYIIDFKKNKVEDDDIDNLKNVISSMIGVARTFTLLGTEIWASYPPEAWSEGVGSAIDRFVMQVMNLKLGNVVDEDIDNFKNIISSMVGVARMFNRYGPEVWGVYPSAEWSDGVRSSIDSFVSQVMNLKLYGISEEDIDGLRDLIGYMVGIARMFSQYGKEIWITYPTSEWSEGVGSAIDSFVKYSINFKNSGIDNFDNLEGLINSMVTTARAFTEYGTEIWQIYPPQSWSEGVGSAIDTLVKYLIDFNQSGINDFDNLEGLINIMVTMAKDFTELGAGIWTTYPPESWSDGVGSAIDKFVNYIVDVRNSNITDDDFDNLEGIINTMASTATLFNKLGVGVWTIYPPSEWTDGVGNSIDRFVGYIIVLRNNNIANEDLSSLRSVIFSMTSIAKSFSSYGKEVWTIYPSKEWSEGVGSAINGFVGYLMVLRKNKVESEDINNLSDVISAMVDTGRLFTEYGKDIWTTYPPKEWADGVGNSIDRFVNYLTILRNNKVEDDDVDNLSGVIESMLSTANMFTEAGKKVWDVYPSKEWSTNVGNTVKIFSEAIAILSKVDDMDALDGLATAIISFANKLSGVSKGALFAKGGVLNDFSKSISDLMRSLPTTETSQSLDTFANALIKISSMGITSTNSIMMLSESISDLGESLKELDLESVEKLSKLSSGFLILSLIDDKKLEDSIRMINASRDDIKSILSDQGKIIQSKTTIVEENVVKNSTAQAGIPEEQNAFFGDMLNVVRNIDRNIDTISKTGLNRETSAEDDEIPADMPGYTNNQKPF